MTFRTALKNTENAALCGVFFLMFFVVAAEIFTRNLFGISNLYSEELSRILLIASVYLGVAAVTRDDAHITFDLLDNVLPARLRGLTGAISELLCLGFCVFAVAYGVKYVHQSATIGLSFTHSYLPFPVWVAQLVIPVAFAITALHLAARLAARFRRAKS